MDITAFAPITANPRGEERLDLIMSKELAKYAGQSLLSTNMRQSVIVAVNAKPVDALKIVKIRKLPPQPVYNMEVDKHHNFAVNGGLVVHNCMDETRYMCKTKHICKIRRELPQR